MRIDRVIPICLTTAIAACGTRPRAEAPSHAPAPQSRSSSRVTFSANQLAATATATVYDAINVLQPELLTGRGRGAPDVYVGAVKQQDGLEGLKRIWLSSVREATYLPYDAAKTLPDAQSAGGAILVTLR